MSLIRRILRFLKIIYLGICRAWQYGKLRNENSVETIKDRRVKTNRTKELKSKIEQRIDFFKSIGYKHNGLHYESKPN